MPYDPDDIYTAEPKLLSLSCFPSFYAPLPPPNYEIIMAGNARYHRVPEDNLGRISMESSSIGNSELDASLLLLDPMGSEDGRSPLSPKHKFAVHPTAFLRLIALLVYIPGFILFIVAHRSRTVAATIFLGFAIARNLLVILHHITSEHIRIHIEFRNRQTSAGFPKPGRTCPTWLRMGPIQLVLEIALWIVLLATSIVATQYSNGWYYTYRHNAQLAAPGCILMHIGNVFYLISICDMGSPSNITITGGISFNYGGDKRRLEDVEQPQVYRDIRPQVQAAGGLSVGSGSGKGDID